ncbi:hypothetical protein R3P38DRAFT_3239608 [Favolaschia claudopus]|uniref:Uncharacterized protein n=1 Tax=Favolaschia claudopus TaxID=2862362 RepID=A0AAV9Z7C9_9AGAR
MTQLSTLSEESSHTSRPRRRTARIQAQGGRAPRKPTALELSQLIDDEAEESDGVQEEEDLDSYEDDFINDAVRDDGEPIPWEATPERANEDTTPVEDEVDDSADKSPTEEKAPIERITTRSIARGRRGQDSNETISDESNERNAAAMFLNTRGHSKSRSNTAGIPSASTNLGSNPGDTQLKLDIVKRPVGRPRNTPGTMLSRTGHEAFQEFKSNPATPISAAPPVVQPPASGSRAPARQDKGKGVDRSVVPAGPTAGNTLPSASASRSVPQTPTSRVTRAKAGSSKRKRVDSEEEFATDLLPTPTAAFEAAKKAASESPVKKSRNVPTPGAYLETTRVKTVDALPRMCEVMDPDLQDLIFGAVYAPGRLPPLRKATLDAWSSLPGPGMRQLSSYANFSGIVFDVLWQISNFVSKDEIINLSRTDPRAIEAVAQTVGGDSTRYTICVDGVTATCISVGTTIQSSLRFIGPVVAPTSAASARKTPLLKYITFIALCQEFERLVSVCGMLFGHQVMKAQLSEDALTIGTKSTTQEKLDRAKPAIGPGVRSASTSYRQTSYSKFDDALPYDAEVPVYDARDARFNVKDDIDNIGNILPRYTDNDGEIPNGACTLVAYTVSQWLHRTTHEPTIGFNIKWAAVLGEAVDENITYT